MDTQPEITETRETKPVKQTEKLSPTGIAAMQGQDALAQSGQVETPPDSDDVPQPPDQATDDENITIHPHNKGPEYLPSPETEPFSIPKSDAEPPEELTEDQEGTPLQPPEGWRPGGIEGGG